VVFSTIEAVKIYKTSSAVNMVSIFGSPRRCGGQGDILSGSSNNENGLLTSN
ncbi:hypothetical protein MKX01_007224, partial [Papaver californicum]